MLISTLIRDQNVFSMHIKNTSFFLKVVNRHIPFQRINVSLFTVFCLLLISVQGFASSLHSSSPSVSIEKLNEHFLVRAMIKSLHSEDECTDLVAEKEYFTPVKSNLAKSIIRAEESACRRIATCGADAEQWVSGGNLVVCTTNNGVSDLDMGEQSGNANQIALNFGNWAIPPGSTISSASIQFTALSNSSGVANFTIQGEDTDDAALYSSTFDVVSRNLTSASVAWNVPTWTADDSGVDQQTPDLSAIIQEIIDRTGYEEGNNIALHITGTGERLAYSNDIERSNAPQLCIVYDTPPEEPEPECTDCPQVNLTSLDGIPNFPTVDLLNICSSADTASLLVYNPAECAITDITLEVVFDDGLFYGGFVFSDAQSSSTSTVGIASLSDVTKPAFAIEEIGPGETMIINFGLKAECGVDSESQEDINFDANVSYTYTGAAVNSTCTQETTEIGAYNSGIREPVLNVLSVSPSELDILTSNTPLCQTITVSQDGIQAFLDEFQFLIRGLDQSLYTISSISINGMTVPNSDYAYNAATQTMSMVIGGAYFPPNFHTGANGDAFFDSDERLTIEVCYTVSGCISEANFLSYQAFYGCNNQICGSISEMQGTLDFTPDYGANATTSSSSFTQGQVCGAPMLLNFDITSSNANPLDGLWEDLVLRWDACDLGISRTSSIVINGVNMIEGTHYNIVSNTVELDFSSWTSDLDGAGGLDDVDNDGLYDDLPGGQSIDVNVTIDLSCPGDEIPCASNGLTCTIDQIDVRGLRNCGQTFQSFADISPDMGFTYGGGETEWTVNALLFGNSERTHVYTTPVNTWGAPSPPYDFSYTFNSEGIGTCQNPGDIYLEISTTNSKSKYVRYETGSATYQNVPVNGVTFEYTTYTNPITGQTDTLGHTLTIPAGSANPTLLDEYNWNFEYLGHCATATDFIYTVRAIEVCNDCAPACETVRACDVMVTYVDWTGINCLCVFEAMIDSVARTNYGYADKDMTIPLTAADLSDIERVRFLPGDTMYYRLRIEVTGTQEQLEAADRYWVFVTQHESLSASPGIPLNSEAEFAGWFIQDQGTGPITEIGIPTSMQQYDNNTRDNYYYPSMRLINNGLRSSGGQWGQDSGRIYCEEDVQNLTRAPEYQDYITGSLGSAWGQSCCDHRDNYSEFTLFWGLNEPCPETNTTLLSPGLTESEDHYNTVYQDFITEYDLEPGDVIYVEHYVPIVHNPGYDIALLNGLAVDNTNFLSTRMYIAGNNTNPNECSVGLYEDCSYPGPDYYTILPNDVNMNNTVTVEDCDVTVEYTFTFPKDVVDDNGDTWFQNEYRPYEFLEYLQPNFPANFIYAGDAEIELSNGTIIPIPDSYIDTNYGNLTCVDDGGGGLCCLATDPSELGGLRWTTQNFYNAQNFEYASYTDVGDETNWTSGNVDPCNVGRLYYHDNDDSGIFPVFMVGGIEDCNSWTLRYSLTPLCPEDVTNTDFSIQAQFAERALAQYSENNFSLQGPVSGCIADGRSLIDTWDINPYGSNEVSNSNSCWSAAWPTHVDDFDRWPFGLITPDPDASPGTQNPTRQTINNVTSVNDFVDNSLDFPALTASTQQLLIADVAGGNETNVFEVCAGSSGGGATHQNVVASIEVPNSIQVINIRSITGLFYTYAVADIKANSIVYAIQMGDLAPGACDRIEIITELLFCPVGLDVDTEICVQVTSGCLDPVKAALLLSNGEVCDVEEACYQYIAEEADIQAEWDPQPMGPYNLCETLPMGVRIKNVKPAVLTQIEQDFWFPSGLNFVPNSFQMCYPGGPGTTGSCVTIPDPIANPSEDNVFGTNYGYDEDAVWNSYIDQNGLPGILSTQDSNRVQILFDVETICDDFVSGTSVYYQASGADPCESRVTSMFINSNPILINGALPQDYAQFYVFADPLEANCGQQATLNLTYLNISPFGESIESKACIELETATFGYTLGSAAWVSPAGHNPNITEQVNGIITEVCFTIPDGIGPNEAFVMSLDFDIPDNLECGSLDLGVQVSSELKDITCVADNSECSVNVLNSVNPVISLEFLPPITVNDQNLTSRCPNPDGTMDICYTVDLNNEGSFYNSGMTFSLYRDLNLNGIIDDAYEPLLATATQTVTMATGTNQIVTGCFTVNEDESCPSIFRVEQTTSCVCSTLDYPYIGIEPEIFSGLESEVTLCPEEVFAVENCGGWSYTSTPSAGASFTPNEAGDSIYVSINSGYGLASPVRITISSEVGGCDPINAEIDIFSLDAFTFGPYESIEACSDGCTVLNLGLPSGYESNMSVLWRPSTYLDDPTSLSPMICDPQNDITYAVDLTFTLEDKVCDFSANFPISVLQQPTENVMVEGTLCPGEVMMAPGGYATYEWMRVNDDGTMTTVAYGSSNTWTPTAAGTFVVEYSNLSDICATLSNVFEVITCVDYGDLPDGAAGTGAINYETELANGGAGHHIVDGLSLGLIVDNELDGQQDTDALGDGADEDGITFLTHTQWSPGGHVRIPFEVTNNTGQQAEIEAWIDWNGDGDFDDPGEWVTDLSDDATGDFGQGGYLTINIPSEVASEQPLGVRIRLSNEDNMTPYGSAGSGEVEDYLIRISCDDTLCVPIIIRTN